MVSSSKLSLGAVTIVAAALTANAASSQANIEDIVERLVRIPHKQTFGSLPRPIKFGSITPRIGTVMRPRDDMEAFEELVERASLQDTLRLQRGHGPVRIKPSPAILDLVAAHPRDITEDTLSTRGARSGGPPRSSRSTRTDQGGYHVVNGHKVSDLPRPRRPVRPNERRDLDTRSVRSAGGAPRSSRLKPTDQGGYHVVNGHKVSDLPLPRRPVRSNFRRELEEMIEEMQRRDLELDELE